MNHQTILESIKSDSRKALEELYNAYGDKFYTYAINKWQLTEDAGWEVVYQTLETLITKLPDYTFESQAHFENWIFKVYTNYLRMYYRKHKDEKFQVLSFDPNYSEQSDDEEGEVEKKVLKGDEIVSDWELDSESLQQYYKKDAVENPMLTALTKELSNLPEKDRDILLLRAQNYSYDEIAALLNIENNQLKVTYHRLKNKLKIKLKHHLTIIEKI